MRISDWSSDVCSSDLIRAQRRIGQPLLREHALVDFRAELAVRPLERGNAGDLAVDEALADAHALAFGELGEGHPVDQPRQRSFDPAALDEADEDRKSVVEGKSVSVRVDLGGRRVIKKKN